MRAETTFLTVFTITAIVGGTLARGVEDGDSQPAAPGFGGPKSIEAQIQRDSEDVEPFFRIPIRVLKPWYDWKKELREKYGISFTLNYQAVYMGASAGIKSVAEDGTVTEGETEAGSGIVDFNFGWTVIDSGSGNEGQIFFKLVDRHGYTDVTPHFLGFDTGSLLMPATGFREYTIRFHELLWQQSLLDRKAGIALGKIDPANYFNYNPLMIPWTDSFSLGFISSPTINLPDPAWGTALNFQPHEHVYVGAVISDPRGDVYQDNDPLYGGEDIWDGKLFTSIELGIVPSFGDRFNRKASLMAWHADEFDDNKGDGPVSPEGQGVVATAYWTFQDRYVPVLLAGVSNGKGANALAEKHLAAMLGIRFKSHDIWSFGLNWIEPPDGALRDQYTFETYYRFQMTEHLAFTPFFQAVYHPSLNEAEDWLNYGGLRARLSL